MIKQLFLFAAGLLLLLSIACGIHLTSITDQDWGEIRLLRLCYGYNYVLAILVFLGVQLSLKQNAMLVGFVFLGGSLLKFSVFFFLIYPDFTADGGVDREELSLFVVPYLICLAALTLAASRVLQLK